MTQVLSQDEIDALLKGMSGGEIETETETAAEEEEGIISYDLTNQEKIIRGRMPTLEIINQRFCRLFRSSLSSMLRKVADISALSVDTIKFGEFLKSLPVPASLHLFRMEPLKGYSLITIESKLVFALIDIFFGGDGTSTLKVEGRDFTPIEDRMIKRVVVNALKDYTESWKPVHAINFEYSRSEMNP
jgi:flagellar motor switch protein FliM